VLKIILVCGARICHITNSFVSFVLEIWNIQEYSLPAYERHCGGGAAFVSGSKSPPGRIAGLCSVADDFYTRKLNIHFMFMLTTTFFPCRKVIYRSQEPKSIPVNRCCHLTR
jgi:hypothetical protein